MKQRMRKRDFVSDKKKDERERVDHLTKPQLG